MAWGKSSFLNEINHQFDSLYVRPLKVCYDFDPHCLLSTRNSEFTSFGLCCSCELS